MRQIWLLFKQGFKGILKYKIQFFVLILLSFLSTFYFVTTTALTDRMNRAYDDVVGSFEKFDYSYIRKTDESNLLSKRQTFVPILDFVPQSNNYIFDKNNNPIHESFNLVLNNHSDIFGDGANNPLGKSNFMTNAFFDKKGVATDGLKEIWDSKETTDILNELAKYQMDRNTGIDLLFGDSYKYEFNKTFDVIADGSKTASSKIRDEISMFSFNTTLLLYKSLHDDLKNKTDNEYKINKTDSLFTKYWFKNELNLVNDFRYIEPVDGSIKSAEEWVGKLNEIETYIFNALESISFYILEEISSFYSTSQSIMFFSNKIEDLKFWNNEETITQSEAVKKANELFPIYNGLAEEKQHLKINWYSFEGLPGAEKRTLSGASEYNKELTFNYIFGSKFDVNSNSKWGTNYLLTKDVDERIAPINMGSVEITENKKDYLTFDINEELNEELNEEPSEVKAKLMYPFGKRGIANPTFIYFNGDDFDSAKSKGSLMAFEKLNRGQQYVSEFGGKNNNYTDRQYKNKSIYSMDIMHHEMASNVSELEFILREELFYYDQQQKINFRFVINDEKNDFNFKVLAGVEANSANEVVISQQFALINGYEIGSKIKIGNMNFVISGFGSDALTYYPLGDPEVPISDVRNTVIVYTPKSVAKNIMSAGNDKDFIASTIMFLSDLDKQNADEITKAKVNIFDSLLMNDKKKFNSMYVNSQGTGNVENAKLYNGIKKFESTTFNLNWELQPQILTVVTIFSIISSVVIIAMAFVTLMFTIKKVIDANSNQIGYLKAMGISNKKIGVSYTGYALVIGAIVVPAAWICAGLFQEVISKIFSNYFSSTLYEFVFDWKTLAIIWSVFLLGALLFSYFTTVWLTRKGALQIINKESSSNSNSLVNIKIKSFEKIPFRYRFALKVSGRGWKQIFAITFSTFVAIIIISVSALTPSVLSVYVNDATKYMKYKNVYDISTPISNLPTSKPSLTATRGIEYSENVYKYDEQLANDKVADILFDNVQMFNDLNWDSSLFPSIVLDSSAVHGREGDLSWQEEYMLRSKKGGSESSEEFVLNMIFSTFGKILNINGSGFTPGSFERFAHFFWASDKNPVTGQAYQGESESTEFDAKAKQVKDNSALFNAVLPQLFNLLTGMEEIFPEGPPEGMEEANSWKEKLLLLAMSFLPNTGMQYLKNSPNKLSQFLIGVNTENYTPGRETLATDVTGQANDSNIRITGLKSNQNVYMLDEISNRNDAFINHYETYKKLNELFRNPLVHKDEDILNNNGSMLYEGSTRTLNIPVLTNLKTKEVFKFENANPILNSLQTNELKLFSDDGVVIPRNAFVYDNRDAVEVGKKDGLIKDTNQRWLTSEYIPANDLSPSKLTHNLQMDPKTNKFVESSSWFIDSYFDGGFEEENLRFELRPQYNYFNIKMYVPKSKLDGRELELLSGTSARAGALLDINNADSNSWRKNGITWGGNVKSEFVPSLAKQAWQIEDSNTEDWVWIAPYNVIYSNKSHIDPTTGAITPSAGFEPLNKSFGWAAENINVSGTPIVIANDNTLPDFINEIKLVNVGTIDTYNTDIVIADQDILNLLTNRSTAKYIPVDYNFYGDQVRTIKSAKTGTTLPVYKTLGPKDILKNMNETKDFYMKDMLTGRDDALNQVVQNIDFTTKYSSFSEAYGVTTGFNGVMKNTPGLFMSHLQGINDTFADNLSITYDKIDLVDSMLGLIITLAESILVISLFLITGIIIITALVIAIMSDIFVSKYNRFIVTMRALGYTKWSIIFSVISISTISNWIFIGIGFGVGIIFTSLLFESLKSFGVFIPFIFAWWVPVVIIVGVVVLSLLSCLISLNRSFKIRLTTLS